jgi:hypothetical protein
VADRRYGQSATGQVTVTVVHYCGRMTGTVRGG